MSLVKPIRAMQGGLGCRN